MHQFTYTDQLKHPVKTSLGWGLQKSFYLIGRLRESFWFLSIDSPEVILLFQPEMTCLGSKISHKTKSFKTQSKLMTCWYNKKLLKAYDLLLSFPKEKIKLNFGHDTCWPSFYSNLVVKEQFLKTLPIYFQNYGIIM